MHAYKVSLGSSKIKWNIMHYLNIFLALSFQIHLYTGNHSYHSCFYTLRTFDRNEFLRRIHQYLRQKNNNICNRNRLDYLSLFVKGAQRSPDTRGWRKSSLRQGPLWRATTACQAKDFCRGVVHFHSFFCFKCIRRAHEKYLEYSLAVY